MTPTPHAERTTVLTEDDVAELYTAWARKPGVTYADLIWSVERALLARLGEQKQPVAWRYTDARGHYRYRGPRPGFDKEYATLKPEPLYAHPPAAQPVAQGERDDDLASGWIAGRAETYAEVYPNATPAEAYQAGAEFALRSKVLLASRSSAQGAAQVPPAGRPLFLIELPDGSLAYKVRAQLRPADRVVVDGPSADEQDGLLNSVAVTVMEMQSPRQLDWTDDDAAPHGEGER